jgi:hypothetical protein
MFEFVVTLVIFLFAMGIVGQVFAWIGALLSIPLYVLTEHVSPAFTLLWMLVIVGCFGGFLWVAFFLWPEIALIVHQVLTQINCKG